eukprot:753835-Hanusia_phi.AAC.7
MDSGGPRDSCCLIPSSRSMRILQRFAHTTRLWFVPALSSFTYSSCPRRKRAAESYEQEQEHGGGREGRQVGAGDGTWEEERGMRQGNRDFRLYEMEREAGV